MSGGRAGPVDWDDVRRRVDAAGAALAAAGAASAEEGRRVLEERARLLARAPEARPNDGGTEVVVFTRGGERLAVDARYVVEVCRPGGLVPLPGAERRVLGLVAWRGELLAVHDPRAAGPLPSPGGAVRVVVLGDGAPAFALLADTVEGIATLPPSALHPPPGGEGGGHLRGVTGDGLLVLDAPGLIHPYTDGGPS